MLINRPRSFSWVFPWVSLREWLSGFYTLPRQITVSFVRSNLGWAKRKIKNGLNWFVRVSFFVASQVAWMFIQQLFVGLLVFTTLDLAMF